MLVVPKTILRLVNPVKAAAKLEKTAVICTTASVATIPSLNIIRQTHAMFLVEARRASDVEIAGFFGHFWNAYLRMFIGSVEQLGPAAFGQNNETPFAEQLALSTLLRWAAAGLEMSVLNQTSRFKNPALLELWTLANNISQLQAVAGSFDGTLSAKYATVNKAIWGIDSNLMFVNVQDAKSTKDVSGSSYSLETAAAVMKDARVPRPSSVRTTSR